MSLLDKLNELNVKIGKSYTEEMKQARLEIYDCISSLINKLEILKNTLSQNWINELSRDLVRLRSSFLNFECYVAEKIENKEVV